MADYIYTMEIRLSPDQQRGVTLVQDIARAADMNIYLSGGAVRDMLSGLPIRDLDFAVQGNPFKLQKDLERAGAKVVGFDEDSKTLHLTLPGNVRAEISMARIERYDKVGKPPVVTPATMIEDLRRRDFTVNAMALSLNPGSRGLLMDPFNGAADIEGKLLRILHNYAFVEDPSRLIRAARFAARFDWPIEERTLARYNSAKENNYIDHISHHAAGYEAAQLAYEDDPLLIARALEKEGWLKILHDHWTLAKVDTSSLNEMKKTRQLMNELGYTPDASAAAMYFLTEKLNEKDVAALRKAIPRKDLVENWHNLEDDAKALAKRLSGKDAATPSRTWKLLSESRADLILFLEITSRQSSVTHKIKNFFTKWREVRKRVPLPEMTELRITPQMPEYAKIADDVFMLLLDGKMRSQTEIMKYLKPLAPPPPPPPPPPPAKRGRGAKAAGAQAGNAPGKAGKKGKAAPVVAVPPTVEVKAAKPLEKVPEPPPVRVAKAKVVKQPAKPAPTKDKKKKTKGKAR
ncbi:MAG: CCA tRNA nucleotidyltransferase [Terriglobales bacterium]|jgi:tRNA nucleotidyltransferase (CCA-adding enzyme)